METSKAQESFLIIDIGTGNVRVAVTDTNGKLLTVERDNVRYERDDRYPDALNFNPDLLWDQIGKLTRAALGKAEGTRVKAITASSQREGIVLLDKKGNSLIGLPNHDHRGREWEHTIPNKTSIYEVTGRYPSSLFSALKLRGIKERRPDLWNKTDTFLSISDWAQYKLSGAICYEHSQASETQLFDVAQKTWSNSLESAFDISIGSLPEIVSSGSILGKVLPEVAAEWGISKEISIVVGGADTQLAIKSTNPEVGDVVIVSGTTTPIVKVLNNYQIDKEQRTWTNCDIEKGRYILEANAGVTGLNYQRLKDIFYPNEDYDVMEEEMDEISRSQCTATLGSLVAEEQSPVVRGGFVFPVPVSHQLSRADFAWATLWDVACSIKENYECLDRVTGQEHTSDYVWACSGGLQSPVLRQFIAGLIGKKLRIKKGYRQASVAGGVGICQEAFGIAGQANGATLEEVHPANEDRYRSLHKEWKNTRAGFSQNF